MKKIDQFTKRVFVICAGICMILITNALVSTPAEAAKKPALSSSNTIFMGIDNGYSYYIFMPDNGNWSFEKLPLTKAKAATW